jgi:hypothetical protein
MSEGNVEEYQLKRPPAFVKDRENHVFVKHIFF